jgi:hypothetical protein
MQDKYFFILNIRLKRNKLKRLSIKIHLILFAAIWLLTFFPVAYCDVTDSNINLEDFISGLIRYVRNQINGILNYCNCRPSSKTSSIFRNNRVTGNGNGSIHLTGTVPFILDSSGYMAHPAVPITPLL